jgi:uncharacterized protein YndB with AHSA1/START domain
MKPQITIETTINAPIEKIWEYWTAPEHITKWCNASDDWHAPHATNDLKIGGTFTTRMEAKDGSAGFDFGGTYTTIEEFKKIEYTMGGEDARKVSIEFIPEDGAVKILETFEAENQNPLEMQKAGWQSILDNFKKHVTAG